MVVTILNRSPRWLDTCYIATRTCKSALTPQDLADVAARTSADKKIRLMMALNTAGHHSIFEHVSVTFGVSGVSRALLAQLTRHRIGWSYSVQSQRYVRFETVGVVSPALVAENPTAREAYQDAVVDAMGAYHRLLDMGVAPEDARFVLPMGALCNLVTTCNLRALMDIHHKRVEVKGAQWEIRHLCQRMVELVTEAEPWTSGLF